PNFAGISCGYGNSYNRFCSHASYASTGNNKVDSDRIGKDYLYSCGCESGGHFFISHVNSTMASNCTFFCYYFLGNVPLSGMYTLLSGPGGTVSFGLNGGSFRKISADFIEEKSVFYAESAPVRYTFKIPMGGSVSFSVLSADCNLPVYKIIPAASLSADTYNTTTRPTSITGGALGIADVDANGQLTGSYTKVEDNSTIINETNNTFYNPATGQTVPIVNWNYDYSDRSYKVTLESGDTATITYGDENITISQITTTEGDTITNNYTIFRYPALRPRLASVRRYAPHLYPPRLRLLRLLQVSADEKRGYSCLRPQLAGEANRHHAVRRHGTARPAGLYHL
ncbi:hypothetical protein, partial [Oscillibacter sp. CU971]|uniref:hypothetical protein n=1 Tax=Oscillibacter sp. CU971 TaxID=2780102 RepID=UPI00195EAC1C